MDFKLGHYPRVLGLDCQSEIFQSGVGSNIAMQVFRLEDNLAVGLPDELVEDLQLKEGDEIEVGFAGQRHLTIARDRSREKAIEELRHLARPLPPGFKFDREELNERVGPNAMND